MGDYTSHVSAFYELLTSCESCRQREFDVIHLDTFVCEGVSCERLRVSDGVA
jgi:hypothetical protein